MGRDPLPTLFQQVEDQAGRGTAHGVVHPACIASGLMTHQLVKWLRDQPAEAVMTLNLTAMELVVSDAD